MKYRRFKNFLIAGLVGFIYHLYIVPSTPILTEIFAIAYVIWLIMVLLEDWDVRRHKKAKARKEVTREVTENEKSA